MKFKNHIGYRFLTDPDFMMEGIECSAPDVYKKLLSGVQISDLTEDEAARLKAYGHLLYTDKTKAFFVTSTVSDKLDMLKVKKNPTYDWTVFDCIKQGTDYTFMFDEHLAKGIGNKSEWQSGCLRVVRGADNGLGFMHVCFHLDEGSKLHGQALFTYYYVNIKTGEQCSDFYTNKNVQDLEELTYKMLCFIFLSENEFVEIAPGRSNGATKKQGKIVNDLSVPITIINSKWNVTSIRTEGFSVSGHFKLVWTGEGRKVSKMVFVQPYEKNGYVRKAANQSILT